jgi:teichuronic acid biosynthesis glycosyltransferase TuaG
MQNIPKVSIIVTTYNRCDLIGETIDSILDQSLTNFELIIVDDGSTDNTESVLKSYQDKRIIHLKTKNWGGPAKPRNIGIEAAKGQYIAFCDDDDIWQDNKLEIQLEHFEDSVVGVGSSAILIGDKEMFREKLPLSDEKFDYTDIISGNNVVFSSLVVKNLGFKFSERQEYKFVEDYDFQARITLETKGCIKRLKTPLVKYRVFLKKDIMKDERSLRVLFDNKSNLSSVKFKRIAQQKYYFLGIRALKQGSSRRIMLFVQALKLSHGFKDKAIIMFFIALGLIPGSLLSVIFKMYYIIRR